MKRKEFGNPKQIILMRHALAESQDEFNGKDSERPLTKKGRQKARKMSQVLLKGFIPSRVATSDYVRALQTAEIVLSEIEQVAGRKVPLVQTEALRPYADVTEWKTFIKQLNQAQEGDEGLLAIGHEPNLSMILRELLGVKRAIPPFRKSGFAVLQHANKGLFELIAFIPPKAVGI